MMGVRRSGSVRARDACGATDMPRRLRVGAGVKACSPSVAHAVFCCVQEAVTNTVRHAQASRLALDIDEPADLDIFCESAVARGSLDLPDRLRQVLLRATAGEG